MRTTETTMRLVLGAMLMAGVLYALVMAPGLLSDLPSTVPMHGKQQPADRLLVAEDQP